MSYTVNIIFLILVIAIRFIWVTHFHVPKHEKIMPRMIFFEDHKCNTIEYNRGLDPIAVDSMPKL